MIPDHNLRVGRCEIRPLLGNRADGLLIDLQQETLSVSVVSLTHANELLAAEWMKRMQNANKMRRYG